MNNAQSTLNGGQEAAAGNQPIPEGHIIKGDMQRNYSDGIRGMLVKTAATRRMTTIMRGSVKPLKRCIVSRNYRAIFLLLCWWSISLSSVARAGFSAAGILYSQIPPGGPDKKHIQFNIAVNESRWEMELKAIDTNVNFKVANIEYDGTNTYAVEHDWHGGTYVAIKTENVPYAGAWDEMSAIWSVFVLGGMITNQEDQSIVNPFSVRHPRPLVRVNSVSESGVFRGFTLSPAQNDAQSQLLPGKAGLPNPGTKCTVLELQQADVGRQIPSRFEILLYLDDLNGQRNFVRKFVGVVTNIIQAVPNQFLNMEMPKDTVVAFVDARRSFENPLIINRFQANGVWPTTDDERKYKEFNPWLGSGSIQADTQHNTLRYGLLALLILTSGIPIFIFRRKTQTTTTK